METRSFEGNILHLQKNVLTLLCQVNMPLKTMQRWWETGCVVDKHHISSSLSEGCQVSVAECGCIKEIFSTSAAWFILDALLYFISLAIYISVFIDVNGYWNLWPRNLWIHHRIMRQMSSCRTACIEPQKTVHCWWGTCPWPEGGSFMCLVRWSNSQGPFSFT